MARTLAITACLYMLARFAGSAAASPVNETVSSRDPRIQYTGTWVDQDNGGHKFTGSVGSSFVFTFQGTAIYYHSVHSPNDGVASFAIDSLPPVTRDASAGTTASDSPQPAVLFAMINLDGASNHTLNVSYVGLGLLGGPYVDFYYLEYTTEDSSVSGAGSSSTGSGSPSVPTPTAAGARTGSTPGSSTKTSNAPIIGGAVGGALALLMLGALLLFFRRRQRAKYNPSSPRLGSVTPFQDDTSRALSPTSASSSTTPMTLTKSGFLASSYSPPRPPPSTIPSFFPSPREDDRDDVILPSPISLGPPPRIPLALAHTSLTSVPAPPDVASRTTYDAFDAWSLPSPPPRYKR